MVCYKWSLSMFQMGKAWLRPRWFAGGHQRNLYVDCSEDEAWDDARGAGQLCYPQAKDATSTRDASEMAEEGAVQMDELFSALGIILEVLATSISLKPYAK